MKLRKMLNCGDFFMKHIFFCLFTVLFFFPVRIMSRANLYTYSAKTDFKENVPGVKDFTGFAEKPIVSKYAGLLKAEEAHVNKFIRLYGFIDYWLGTPYLWGGCSKGGIDCSCFVQTLFNKVFNIKIKRTSLAQFCDKDVALFTNRNEYQLGDLVFFKTNISRETRNNRVTHVGFYLTNGYFVQSSSAGVNIANLNRGYWKSRVVAAGRLKESYYKKAGIAIPGGDIQDRPVMDVEENSDFEPVPFPDDKEYVINEYSSLLKISPDKILIPEVFDFIEKNRYAPYSVTSRCPRNMPNSNCLATVLFKDVFDIQLDAADNNTFLAKNTGKLSGKEQASFLDIVLLKSGKKGTKDQVAGMCLYNDYFLHLYNGEIAISSLADPAFEKYEQNFYRINEPVLKEAFSNIIDIRKGIKPVKADNPPPATPANQPPQNILKKDTMSLGSQPAAALLQTPGEPPVGRKKKKKKTS
jgi:murein DD-endopeptidase / murein LD-carboxypeptidase